MVVMRYRINPLYGQHSFFLTSISSSRSHNYLHFTYEKNGSQRIKSLPKSSQQYSLKTQDSNPSLGHLLFSCTCEMGRQPKGSFSFPYSTDLIYSLKAGPMLKSNRAVTMLRAKGLPVLRGCICHSFDLHKSLMK